MNRRGTGYQRPRRPAGADAVSGLDLRRQRDQELMRRVDQQARAVAAQAEAEVRECITANLQNGQAGVRECVTQLISGNAQEQEAVYGGVEHDSAEQVLLERTTSSTSISSSSSSSLSGMVSLRHKVGAEAQVAEERARSWSWPQERHDVNLSGSPTRRSSSLVEGSWAQASVPIVPQAAAAKVLGGGDGAGSEAAVGLESKRGSCSEEAGSGGCACGIASISIGTAGCGGDTEGGAWAREQQGERSQEQEIVRLNVGGQGFSTTLQTLRSQDSMLAAMFSGRFRPGPSDAQVESCTEPFAPPSILTRTLRCAGRAHRP